MVLYQVGDHTLDVFLPVYANLSEIPSEEWLDVVKMLYFFQIINLVISFLLIAITQRLLVYSKAIFHPNLKLLCQFFTAHCHVLVVSRIVIFVYFPMEALSVKGE